MNAPKPTISLGVALLPMAFLVLLLSCNIYVFGDAALDGSVQIVLVVSTGVVALLARIKGIPWANIEAGMVKSVTVALRSIFILLLVGALAGTWLLSGIIPTIIYLGLQVIHPPIFLFAACITCAVISVATGSSWSTIATLGTALVAIGIALGIHVGLVAGAIISGAYFGDKLSPLSDTTNLAAAVTETPLFTHIRYMLYTTLPSIGIALGAYLVIGFFAVAETQTIVRNIDQVRHALDEHFVLSGWLLLVPCVVVLMISRGVSAAPSLLIGSLMGGLLALFVQPQLVQEVAQGFSAHKGINAYVGVMKAIYGRTQIQTGLAEVDALLSTRGMAGMLNTVWLIICAMSFGGAMEAAGFLGRIVHSITRLTRQASTLIASTSGTCVFFNLTASDQYLSVAIPGRMFSHAYKQKNLKSEVLSRTLEDSATVTSVLIPWNTCGATQASILGVSTFLYAPFCFFNLLSPCFTLIYAFIGYKIRKQSPTPSQPS